MDELTNDIIKYKKGELTPKEMHALEKRALSDPFLAEALEGIEKVSADELNADIHHLNEKTIRQKKSDWFVPLRIAAAIALIATVTFIIYQFIPRPENLALQNEKTLPKIQIPAQPDSVINQKNETENKPSAVTQLKPEKKQRQQTVEKPGKQKRESTTTIAPATAVTQPAPDQIKNELAKEIDPQPTEEIASSDDLAQNKIIDQNKKDKSYATGRAMPQVRESKTGSPPAMAIPVGGQKAYDTYLKKSLHYPQEALNKNITGYVTIEFTVFANGQRDNYKVVSGLGYGCEEEAIRLIKEGPQWSPAIYNNQPIDSHALVKVKFDPTEK